MTKIQLYVLDEDNAYADRLAAFIRTSEFGDKLQVKLFSKLDFVMELLDKPELEGILLLSEAYYPNFTNRCTSLFKIILSEQICNSREAETKLPFLYRFQSLHQLISRLMAFYWEQQKLIASVGSKRTQIVSVFGSVGNSGKTITAIHLAKQLSFRGERVFYLSLESISSASSWLEGDSSRFSQLLYYLKSTPELLGPKIELLKSHDPRLRFDYMTPSDQIREMQEMSGEDVRILLEALTSLNQYDFIIIDLEASVHPRIVRALELSEYIMWIVLDDLNGLFKAQALCKQIGKLQGVHFVVNKYTGKQMNNFSVLGKSIECYLPYIPEWKIIHSAEQIWQSVIFSEQVYGMFTACKSSLSSRSLIANEEAAAS
ncbi:AAA family ATPase [Paenibacillus sp. SYP-B3998]|uniref:AAA family ATPase n=1 Tax=Paenibacillus sp. SYP-B3998 TaxID=2678564 RepID=A0A6G3ZW90_9BACL|nr:AAA family ATPase [Paenibacillus sp. SYP-B3998]NEW06486.1 AAA family ATPase [Paenibacillus sp. SYP-B3998]